MYLKEIKLSGFKSFADKININLDDNITCVVGPNGSGKSNIVDAVRWVLGEQSVKNLRGSNNMSDVIFSGSKSRKPLNLAFVTLVFDNSDGYLKVPYTEISITRKVFRSGENEYLINNEKCRLKDINDLFLDSGIGKYAFNIISQGEVANIINSSPYERRGLFEEAAGVLKYKKRKEEAFRKLAKTNENMVRVNDIISELDNQVEPLKKQRDDALKYLDYQERLSDVEVALIVHDLDKLNASFHENEDKIVAYQNKIASFMSKTSSSDAEMEKLKDELNETNKRIVELNNEYISLTKEIERLNGKKNILSERSKYESNDIKVHENISDLKERIYSLDNELLSIKNDLERISSLDEEFSSKLNDLNNLLDKKRSARVACEDKISFNNKKVTELDYRIKYLSDYIEQGGGISNSVRKVLSNPKLLGIHNTISNLIEIPNEYLIALTVGLGGAKDYVVVDNTLSAKKAISFLKDNNLGRVTFYPLDVIKPRFIDDDTFSMLRGDSGFINVLSEVICYDARYSNIIKNQLGNVILVSSVDDATRLSKLINNKYRIVTLAGEVINVGGSLTGGKIKTNSINNEKVEKQNLCLNREKLIRGISELENELASLISDEKKYQDLIFEVQKDKVVNDQNKYSKEEYYNKILNNLSDKKEELESLEGLSNNVINDEEEKIVKQYYDTLALYEEVSKKSKIELNNKEKIESKIEEHEATFRVNNNELRTLESKLKECEIGNSKASVKMDNLLNVLSESYQMTYEKAKVNYVLEIEEEEARRRVNEYRRCLKDIGSVNVGAIDEYDRVSTRYEFLRKQNSDLKEARDTLMEIISELDEVMKAEFLRSFKEVQVQFDKVFKELFNGGEAVLELTDSSNLLETGININVTPPGKKLSSINLLSGGEKTLTAISLLFAILNIKNIPFCLFDEVEAALDEANVDRFGSYLKKYNSKTQLIIITHKKKTMEYANCLYGITMQESGVSKLVSVKLVD